MEPESAASAIASLARAVELAAAAGQWEAVGALVAELRALRG